jgi:hypothetical protein
MEGIQNDKMVLYYAVNGTGQGVVFIDQPTRDNHFKCWKGPMLSCVSMVVSLFETYGFNLPNIRWSDEPVKIELNLKQI